MIAPRHQFDVVDCDAVCFLAAEGEFVLRGRVYVLLVPLLDGTRTSDEVVDRLEPLVDTAEIYFALDMLERRWLICEGGTVWSAADAYWAGLALPAPFAGRAHRVCVAGIDAAPLGRLTESLHAMGFEVVGDTPDLDLVVTADYLAAELAAFNQDALRTGRPWLLINPFGTEPLTGPLFRPAETACWECLAQRLRHHRPIASFLARRGNGHTVPVPARALPATLGAALDLSVALLAQSLAGHSGTLHDTIYALDLANWAATRHAVTRRPQCPACGQRARPNTWEAGLLRASAVAAQGKGGALDGRVGRVPPDETLARYAHHVSPISGLVAKITTVPSIDGTHFVCTSGPNYAFPAGDLSALRHALRSTSSGKGVTEKHAQASALCESLERYSGVFQGDEPRTTATYEQLADDAIHPAALLLFSERQYRERDAWNARGSPFSRVPLPFDEQRPFEWTPAWSLTRAARVYLPTAYCFYAYSADPQTRFCFADSNGCAAGNTLAEAVLQGFLELIERDAVAIWWYNRLRTPTVDLAALGSDRVDALTNAYAERGREMWALDLTHDLGIPVFAALSRRVEGPRENILFGFGCHLDPAAALLRAVNELNQGLSRIAHASLDRDRAAGFAEPALRDWWNDARVADHPFLGSPRSAVDGLPRDARRGGLAEDIDALRQTVEQRGMEVIVQDQTRADVGLPVVRVVVPGLRHFWPRFAPGRLYDVPVTQGTPTDESALNPVAMFL